jgi:hypothetical protein
MARRHRRSTTQAFDRESPFADGKSLVPENLHPALLSSTCFAPPPPLRSSNTRSRHHQRGINALNSSEAQLKKPDRFGGPTKKNPEPTPLLVF